VYRYEVRVANEAVSFCTDSLEAARVISRLLLDRGKSTSIFDSVTHSVLDETAPPKTRQAGAEGEISAPSP
jgi:hypothetical protein